MDQAYEKAKGENKIGSTLKGIGPTYQDKIGRQGLRVGDIQSPEFSKRFKKLTDIHFSILEDHDIEYDWSSLESQFLSGVEFLKSFQLIDSEYFINNEVKNGSSILAEGAQGSLLDIDFGSYPFVTSSNTVTAGACTGLGIPPKHIGEVYGIFKAYSTRVGSGPFPTELMDENGEKMRKVGNEFGSTTGRPRRCGWIDLPSLKYSIMINGVTKLLLMKADVLNVFSIIKICTHYKLENGQVTEIVPYEIVNEKITPVYKEVEGWNCSIENTDVKKLPSKLVSYIELLEKELEVPIMLISTGPDRSQTIFRN